METDSPPNTSTPRCQCACSRGAAREHAPSAFTISETFSPGDTNASLCLRPTFPVQPKANSLTRFSVTGLRANTPRKDSSVNPVFSLVHAPGWTAVPLPRAPLPAVGPERLHHQTRILPSPEDGSTPAQPVVHISGIDRPLAKSKSDFFPLDFITEKLCSALNSSEVGFRHAFNISPVKIHCIGAFRAGGVVLF